MIIKPASDSLELLITDCHLPGVDRGTWDLIKQVARHLKPSLLWVNGDNLDAYQVSKFATNPKRDQLMQDELDESYKLLQGLVEASGGARRVMRSGNHDERVEKYVQKYARALASLRGLTVPKLLKLDKLGFEWDESSEKSRVGHLWHLHGHEIKTGFVYPARDMLMRTGTNVISGHVHKFTTASANSLSGESHICWSIGCVQDFAEAIDYEFNPNWQNGMALIEYTKSGLFHVVPVEVYKVGSKKHCMVYGKLYTAEA